MLRCQAVSTKPTKTRGRSRSGCFTCRIRHKNCVRNEQESVCEDCKKLRLECLKGAGRNRPQWLKDGDPRRTRALGAIKVWTKRRVQISEMTGPNQILKISHYENESEYPRAVHQETEQTSSILSRSPCPETLGSTPEGSLINLGDVVTAPATQS